MTELIHARAYHDGRLVCDRALVTVIARDERLGLTPRERRHMTVRFVHGIEPAFRAQLMQVMRRRGARSRRLAAALHPIELELDGARRLAGRIEPPAVRHCSLEQTDFGARPARRLMEALRPERACRRPASRCSAARRST